MACGARQFDHVGEEVTIFGIELEPAQKPKPARRLVSKSIRNPLHPRMQAVWDKLGFDTKGYYFQFRLERKADVWEFRCANRRLQVLPRIATEDAMMALRILEWGLESFGTDFTEVFAGFDASDWELITDQLELGHIDVTEQGVGR